MGNRKDVQQLLKRLPNAGFEVKRSPTGHWRVTNRHTGRAVTVAQSPKRPALDRVRADLRRIGAPL